MGYLQKKDYLELIFDANTLNETEDITDMFFSKYKEHTTDNPKFENKLKEGIDKILNGISKLIKESEDRDKKNEYKNPDGSPIEQRNLETYRYSTDKIGLGLVQFRGEDRMSKQKILLINEGYNMLLEKINTGDPVRGIKQKIKWNGELKEFAEMIVQLETSNWIELPHGELNPIVKTLCLCFDFSKTKRKEKSNTENSLLQYLKPSERGNKIFTKRYIRKFDSIISNNTSK